MEILKLSNDSSFPNDSIYDSSILIINESSIHNNNNNNNNNNDNDNNNNNDRDIILAPLSLHRSSSSSSSSLRRQAQRNFLIHNSSINLDITRISDRILVASRCWTNPQIEKGQNGTQDLADFLIAKYRDRFLIWNIGTPESLYRPGLFNHRIIPFTLPRSQNLSLKSLFHLCHSILGWLQISEDNVVIVQCNDGWGRSGLLVSCLLKFSGHVESTFDGMNLFQSRRLKTRKLNINPCNNNIHNIIDSPSVFRYLKYFNETLNLKGRIPNPLPLNLHQIIISSIPNFDGSGNCFPGLELFQNNELILTSSSVANKNFLNSEIYLFQDDHNIIFKFKDNFLEKDLSLHIFHCHPKTGQRSTILFFTFNTAFFHPGVIRLRPDDLEMPFRNVEPPALTFPDATRMKSGLNRFNEDFCLDLILLPTDQSNIYVDYTSTIRNNFAKNLLRLSQMHPIRPDIKLFSPLQLQGYPRFYIKLALQLYANDIHQAHEFLCKLTSEYRIDDLEKSFNELKSKITRKSIEIENELSDTSGRKSTESKSEFESKNEEKEENQIITFNPLVIESNKMKYSKSENSSSESMTAVEIEENSIEHLHSDVLKARIKSFIEHGTNTDINNDTDDNNEICENVLNTMEVLHDKVQTIPPPPPPPLPLFLNALPPPPPPMPQSKSKNISEIQIPNERPKIKNTLHWNELRIQDLDNNFNFDKDSEDLNLSIWHEFAEGNFKTQLELNTQQFEELFCVDFNNNNILKTQDVERKDSIKRRTSLTGGTNNKNIADNAIPVVIDIRRANNVGIGLARFNKRYENENFADLIQNIYNYNENLSLNFNLDDFLTLQSILPTDEEIKSLKLIRESGEMKILLEKMGKAEKFMYFVAIGENNNTGDNSNNNNSNNINNNNINNNNSNSKHNTTSNNSNNENFNFTRSAIEFRIFELTAWQDLSTLMEKYKILIKVLEYLKSSSELKIILKATLDLGNLATYDYGKRYKSCSFNNNHNNNNNINYSKRRDSAFGFTLDSLCKLHEVKSVDGHSNLLIFLVSSLNQVHPEVINLPDHEEFKELELIKGWSERQLETEYSNLLDMTEITKQTILKMVMISEANDCENNNNNNDGDENMIKIFWNESKIKIEKFQSHLISQKLIIENFHSTWSSTRQYFGDSSPNNDENNIFTDVSKFLSTIFQFFKNFQSAAKQIQTKAAESNCSAHRNIKDTYNDARSRDSLEALSRSSSS